MVLKEWLMVLAERYGIETATDGHRCSTDEILI